MSDKGPCSCTAVYRLKNRGFHFQIIIFIEEIPDGADNLCPRPESIPHLGIDSQIYIALAVAEFLILNLIIYFHLAVYHPLLGYRKRSPRSWKEAQPSRQ